MSDVHRDAPDAAAPKDAEAGEPERVAGYDDLGAPDWADSPGETDRGFHTDAVRANLAAERGMGVGAAELAAQRDPAGAVRDALARTEDAEDAEGEGGE